MLKNEKNPKPVLDLEDKTLPIWFDEYRMARTDKSDTGIRDSLGRTFLARIAYGPEWTKDYQLCMKGNKLFRHPDYDINDVSRDHLIYFFMMLKMDDERETAGSLWKNLHWKISDEYSFTPDVWLFIRALFKRSSRILYYIYTIPTFTLLILWSKSLYKIFRFETGYDQDEWNKRYLEGTLPQPSRIQKKVSKIIFPVYSLHIFSWQLHFLPGSWCRSWLQKLILWFNEPSNYLIRLLCNDKKILSEEIDYQPSGSYRWGTAYDLRNVRDIRIITDPEKLKANVLDRDLLWAVYETKKKSYRHREKRNLIYRQS